MCLRMNRRGFRHESERGEPAAQGAKRPRPERKFGEDSIYTDLPTCLPTCLPSYLPLVTNNHLSQALHPHPHPPHLLTSVFYLPILLLLLFSSSCGCGCGCCGGACGCMQSIGPSMNESCSLCSLSRKSHSFVGAGECR